MMKDNLLSRIINAVHVIFFSSLLCFGITFLSGTLLMIPAFTAAFMLGRTLIYNEFDITDSVIGNYLGYFKEALGLMKYVVLEILFILNILGVVLAGISGMEAYAIICLCIAALILTTIIYLAAYYTFFSKDLTLTEAVFCMVYKPAFAIVVFTGIVLLIFFFSSMIAVLLVLIGTAVLFVIELITFLHILYYKKLQGMLENEKFAALVAGKKEKEKH